MPTEAARGRYDGSAPPELAAAVELFNRGAWLACHETFEALWLAEPGRLRDLHQGILQIAVALLHEERGNRGGAVKLLDSGLLLLGSFAPSCLGLDIAGLLRACVPVREHLNTRPECLPDHLQPKLRYHPT